VFGTKNNGSPSGRFVHSFKMAPMSGTFHYDGAGNASYGSGLTLTSTGFTASGSEANSKGVVYWYAAQTTGVTTGTGSGQVNMTTPDAVWLADGSGAIYLKTSSMSGDEAWGISNGSVGPVSGIVELNGSGFNIVASGTFAYGAVTGTVDSYPTEDYPGTTSITRSVGGSMVVASSNTTPLNGTMDYRAAAWVDSGSWMKDEGFFSARDGGMAFIAGVPGQAIKLESSQVRFGPSAAEDVNPSGYTVHCLLQP